MNADEAALLEVPDVGPIVARRIAAFFHEPHNRQVIAALREAGVHWPEGAPQRAESGPTGRPDRRLDRCALVDEPGRGRG